MKRTQLGTISSEELDFLNERVAIMIESGLTEEEAESSATKRTLSLRQRELNSEAAA